MKKKLTLWLLVVVTTLLNNSVLGQKTTPKLTLEDIYKNNLYSAKGFGGIRRLKIMPQLKATK